MWEVTELVVEKSQCCLLEEELQTNPVMRRANVEMETRLLKCFGLAV